MSSAHDPTAAPRPLHWVPGQQVLRASGRPVTLADLVDEGGQGRLFAVQESADYLAKMYTRPREGLDVLVGAFEARGLQASAATGVLLASPRGVLTREPRGPVVGCLIPRLPRDHFDGLDLWVTHEAHVATLEGRLHVARLVARAVAALHDNGIVIGDIKPENMWIHSDRRVLALIDLDSVTVLGRDGHPLHATTAFTAEYRAPEVVIGQVPTTVTDAFAVALIVAEILLGGIHPFARSRREGGVNDDISARIDKSHSWLLDPGSYFLPEPHPGAAALGPVLAGMFQAAATSVQRPSAAQWLAALEAIELARCQNGHEVLPGAICALDGAVVAPLTPAPRPETPDTSSVGAEVWAFGGRPEGPASDRSSSSASSGVDAPVRPSGFGAPAQPRVVGARGAGGDRRRRRRLTPREVAVTAVPVAVVLLLAMIGGPGLRVFVRALAGVLVVGHTVLAARSVTTSGASTEAGMSALAAVGSLLAVLITLYS